KGGVPGQLAAVATAELGPSRRIMPKPFAQRGAGRGILGPIVDRRVFFANAARPQAIDQHPSPVGSSGRLICSLDRHALVGSAHSPSLVAASTQLGSIVPIGRWNVQVSL